MRSRGLLLTLLSTLGLCGVASAASKPVIEPPTTSIALAPMKVKGYTMSVSATQGSGLSVYLSKGAQSHSYSFAKKSFSLALTKNLTAGTLSAHLGKYGKFQLHLAASGALVASGPGKGCTGPKALTRPLRVISSSGSIVLDKSFFRTVAIGHVKASATKTGKIKCKVKTGPPHNVTTRSLSVISGTLSAIFTPGAHAATAAVTVTTSSNPLVTHSISVNVAPSNLVIHSDASAATFKSSGALLTGTGSYAASQYFLGGSSGALTGSLVAHFDSIGAQKVAGTQAFLSIPGFDPPPKASFSDSAGGNAGEYDFFDSSYAPAGSIVAWSWAFGDNSTSSLQNPTHVYLTSGTYPVTLTVTDNHGKKATVTQNVAAVANKPPTASFTADTSPGAFTVNFNDTSTDPDGSVVAWSWSFGDGSTSTQQYPTHTYAGPGPYTVTLTVTDNSGAQSSSSQSVSPSP